MNNIETERLIFTSFRDLSEEEKKVLGDSWANPFNARFNGMKDPYGSVEKLSKLQDPTFNNLGDYYDCMYFRVVRDKATNEIVGNCRYGKYYDSEDNSIWDVGCNMLLKYWHSGYGVEVLTKIIELARNSGVKTIIGGADKENFGSYKAMIRSGFMYDCIDEDGDYRYRIDLNKEPLTSDERNKVWNEHLFMVKRDLGEDVFQDLEHINNLISEMVARIHNGEDEEFLVKEYFEMANKIRSFPFG